MRKHASSGPDRVPTRRLLLAVRVALCVVVPCVSIMAVGTGCATRTVRHPIMRSHLVEVDLVRQVKGFTKQPRGFEHPAAISVERLGNILRAIEIEAKADEGGTIRQPAFHPEIVDRTAEALHRAFREAGPDDEIGVNVIRKQARLGILHTKFLTSFLTYMENDQLFLLLRRVDWPVPKARESEPLPRPQRNRKPMDFTVVTGDPIYFAGLQDLEIDWKNAVFRQAFRLPGTTHGEKRRREVLDQVPVPKTELDEAGTGDVGLGGLSPEQLRALADLEEERRNGTLTESAYQRARRQLMRER